MPGLLLDREHRLGARGIQNQNLDMAEGSFDFAYQAVDFGLVSHVGLEYLRLAAGVDDLLADASRALGAAEVVHCHAVPGCAELQSDTRAKSA